ncbi:ATP-grasp fold amidoligase family protein [Brevundimonas sp.]|uniref:ATP-grasp fold amidoligase family protein n=2 Tax=Brevundimonas TaxID=41275 RepID=UPI0035B4D9E3
MHDVWLRPDTIVRKLRELIDESPSAGNRFLIEAWVTGANAGIPHDYKVYVIGGRAAFLLRVDRNTRPASLAFFDGDLAPLGDSDVLVGDTATRGDSTPPPNGVQLIATAERIATHVGVNFLGVDLYSDGERVLLGELTTVPGGPYYGRMFRLLPELDRALGERWRATNLAMGLPIPDVASEPPAKRSVGVR